VQFIVARSPLLIYVERYFCLEVLLPGNIPNAAVLRIVRLALLASVLIFGFVALLVHRSGSGPIESPIDFGLIRMIFLAIFAAIAILLIVLRSTLERAPTYERRASLAIMAWALGESAAIMGGVFWFLSGSAGLYTIGLAVFLLGLVTIGVPEAA
jgi:hypothetical protein